MDDFIEIVLAEITTCLHLVSSESLAKAGALIEVAPRIFVSGAGRSGLVMRALGIRLMHLGKTVHVVGESTTPSIKTNELLIIGSGSGQTPTQLAIAQKAQSQGAKILVFTTNPNSPLANWADQYVTIPAPSLKGVEEGNDLEIDPTHGNSVRTIFTHCMRRHHPLVNAANRRQRFSNA